MAEFSATPPRSVTHPPAPAKPLTAAMREAKLRFSLDDGTVVVELDENSRLILTPMAAMGIAGVLVQKAMEAAPGTFLGDERIVLSRILAEAKTRNAPPRVD